MFGFLFRRRFSSKCKSSIKDIKARLVLLKSRKAAQVKFLKKDVADLLSNGFDINAFGRTEALLTEMNKLSCYEMIEQSCNHILKQLSRLQKRRECPPESIEDVATLIYAAARFSDLPKLCKLRCAFTERYGSSLESSINAEFVEKMGNSLTMNKKLQLMRDISKEFSIKWDSKAFEYTMSNPSAPASDRSRKAGSLYNMNNAPNVPLNRTNETALKKDDHEISSQVKFDLSPESTIKREQVKKDIKMERRDIRIVSSTKNDHLHDPTEKTMKALEKENSKPNYMNNLVPPPVKHRSSKIGPHVGDQHSALDAQTKSMNPTSNATTAAASYRHQNIKMGSESAIQEEQPNVSRYMNTLPPYLKQDNNSKYGAYKEDLQVGSDNARFMNMPPPYVKQNGFSKLEDHIQDLQVDTNRTKPAHDHMPRRVQEKSEDIERGRGERKVGGEKDLSYGDSMPRPRSVNRRNPKVTHTEEDSAEIEGDGYAGRNSSGRRRHTPRSVSTFNDEFGPPKYDEDRVVVDDQDSSFGRTHSSRRRMSSYAKDCERLDYENMIDNRNTSSRRRRHMRHAAPIYDEEEMIMDDLLIHYSKKGLGDKPDTPKLQVNKGGEFHARRTDDHDMDHLALKVGHPPVRVSSLPPNLNSPKEVPKAPVRATSLQPDLLHHVHPKLPDYDELAARFIAMKKK
ncbi:hypothetical protein QJS10_CPA02g00241 [Acorus calamus]|uniref:IST1-like protein n=1 Tax=Acorus calamus TaxID=4465 RepID=A0AAV9F9N4_ACOCL|nr:hypothetical protein QJS10_CPA02g00250 [Acorus calamus]KAK1323741.1 hypothetical protein QJS10_CPA02g00241 [Acorus calamus]